MEMNAVSYISFDQGKKTKDAVERFLKGKSIMVFLLHAERERDVFSVTAVYQVVLTA